MKGAIQSWFVPTVPVQQLGFVASVSVGQRSNKMHYKGSIKILKEIPTHHGNVMSHVQRRKWKASEGERTFLSLPALL